MRVISGLFYLFITLITCFCHDSRVNIQDLLIMSGQNPEDFIPDSSHSVGAYGRLRPNFDYDFEEYRPRSRPPSVEPHENGLVAHERTIDNLLGFVKGVILCGGEGWCGTRCCPEGRYPSAYGSQVPEMPYGAQFRPGKVPSEVRRTTLSCYPVCMPACTAKCIEAARILMGTKNQNSIGISAVENEDNKAMMASIPLCRPACMPKCEETCLRKRQKPMRVTCRPACMPDCTPSCVASPPLMVPCASSSGPIKGCQCPPGYQQCSKFTCCMRYRTMAVKYRKLLPGYLFADNATSVLFGNSSNAEITILPTFNSTVEPCHGMNTTSDLVKLSVTQSTNSTDEDVEYIVNYDYDLDAKPIDKSKLGKEQLDGKGVYAIITSLTNDPVDFEENVKEVVIP